MTISLLMDASHYHHLHGISLQYIDKSIQFALNAYTMQTVKEKEMYVCVCVHRAQIESEVAF